MKISRIIPWLAAGLLVAQSASPSPDELIAKAIAAQKAQSERGWKYTYREDHEQSQLGKDGKVSPLKSMTYDHIMLEGEDYKKLILIDGRPPDAKTQKRIDEDLEKARSERRKRGRLSLHRTVSLGGLDLLQKLFDNKVTGEETVLGRKTWRMESDPRPGYKPANKQEEEALASRRVSWFDQQDGFEIKESNLFIRAANGWQPGSTIDLEFGKIGEDWMPDNVAIRMDMKMAPGVHGRVASTQRYSGYKRFTVDSVLTPQ